MMLRTNSDERIVDNESIDDMAFLKEANINSVYIKVLGDKDDKCGLFMIGDSRRELFNGNMSFYNAIIAQYNIAISNARIYNN